MNPILKVNVSLGEAGSRELPGINVCVCGELRPVFRWVMLAGLWLTFTVSSPRLQAIEVLHSFSSGTNGMNPRAALVQGADGELYGTSEQGGVHGFGTIFKVNTNGTLTLLHSFNNTNGANPYAGLIIGADGNYFGTTYGGTLTAVYGCIFRFTTNGSFKMLSALPSAGSAALLTAGLVLARDGNYYGTTWSGTSAGNTYGSIFRFRVLAGGNSGLLTSLYGFASEISGAYPNGGLVQGPYDFFYGTTSTGGVASGSGSSYGTVFRVSTNGTFTSLCSFFKTNGASPNGALAFGAGGALYGATTEGGTSDLGTIFRVTTNGVLTSLVSFNGTNGSRPNGGLVLAGDGNFYGTTKQGGLMGNGTIFRVTTNGILTTLHSFVGDQAAYPYAGLALGGDGNLFGCTYNGFVFRVTTNGDLTTLATFNNSDGANPCGNFVVGPDGKLYGTTQQGGSHGNGTIFTVGTNGSFTLLGAFAGTNGANPYSGLTFGPDGLAYGTAVLGGSVPKGSGVVYQMDSNGGTKALANFTGLNGENPYAGLTWGPGGRLYGTTRWGGNANFGAIFCVTTNGLLTNLYSLTGSSGNYPYAGLTLGSDSMLYGVTWANQRSCFKISTNGAFTRYLMTPAYTYTYPYGTLAVGPDGSSMYGTCDQGGVYFRGAVYKFAGGTITLVASFLADTNGASPRSSLLLAPDQNFYGTARWGGLYGRGTVFQVTTNGVLTSLESFAGPDGGEPTGSVTLAGDGNFYGTTTYGGQFNAGVVYRLRPQPVITTQPQNQTNLAGTQVAFGVGVQGAPALACRWHKNGNALTDGGNFSGAGSNLLQIQNLSAADTAAYSVVITNAFGSVTSAPAFLQVNTPPVILVNDSAFGFDTNGFGFSISGTTGSLLQVLGSTNLVDWSVLGTLTNQAGLERFVDPVTNRPSQFYRAKQL